jgi:hypothetical protein
LTNVELTPQYDQRALDILLSNPQRLFAFDMVLDFNEIVVASDSSSSGQTRRFQNPNIVMASEIVLRELLLVFSEKISYPLEQLILSFILLVFLFLSGFIIESH